MWVFWCFPRKEGSEKEKDSEPVIYEEEQNILNTAACDYFYEETSALHTSLNAQVELLRKYPSAN